MAILEVAGIQDLDARLMVTIERGYDVAATSLL